MVSKVAVIALVAIVACPILLGYAFNVSEVAKTTYEKTGDSVDVTDLLKNDVDYNYVHADVVDLNSHFLKSASRVFPVYSLTSTYTPLKTTQVVRSAAVILINPLQIHNHTYYCIESYYNIPTVTATMNLNFDDGNGNTSTQSVNNFFTFCWNSVDNTFTYQYLVPNGLGQYIRSQLQTVSNVDELKTVSFTYSAGFVATSILTYDAAWVNDYVDISAGYYLNTITMPTNYRSDNETHYWMNSTVYRSLLTTMDLSSIVDSNYSFEFRVTPIGNDNYALIKTTDSSGPHWEIDKVEYIMVGGQLTPQYTKLYDLHYDSARTSNTYQILFTPEKVELRYVGNWPTVLGRANYYLNYTIDEPVDAFFAFYLFGKTPKMRIDDAEFAAFEYPAIRDQSYEPGAFKTNPSTKITNVITAGTSLTFGSNTYNIVDGNIEIGTREISLRNMVLDSVPIYGGYENRINGYVVSTTAQPATITFSGLWNATITTDSMEGTTTNEMEWLPGEFGWDGMDINFLIVGIMTSVAAMIAVGIYAKSRRLPMIPVVIVCGSAALLFFMMI